MMDTSKRILIGVVSAAVVMGGVATGLILNQAPEKADLPTIHTEAVTESLKETLPPTIEAETETAAPTENGNTPSVITEVETYTSGKVSIQYLVVNKMDDADRQAKVSELLKSNTLSMTKANEIGEPKDTLSIKCKIISVDRKRITATYTGSLMGDGAAHLVNLFYSNTTNLPQIQGPGFEDFIDAYTMTGYVLNDDMKLSGISADVEAAVLEYRSSLDIDTLTTVSDSTDFPLSPGIAWPESFSYEKQGVIFFSMPVPHTSGGYVIVSFNPSTK